MAVLAVVAVAAGCSSNPGAPPPAQTLRIAVNTATDYLPYYVMVEEGIAARLGLRFEEAAMAGGTAALAALADGSVDIAPVGVVSLAAGTERGTVPSAAVGIAAGSFASPEHPLLGVLAAPGVRSWADLAGRRVAVNNKLSLGAAGLAGRMRSEGVAPAELVEVPFPNMGLGVRTGDLAAAVSVEPYLTQSELRGDGHLLGWVVGGAPMERVEPIILVARTELLESRPGALKAFLRAYREAVTWIASHEPEARVILAARLSVTPEVAERIRLPSFRRDGRNDPAQVQAVLDAIAPPGSPAQPSARLYDERLLDAVLAER